MIARFHKKILSLCISCFLTFFTAYSQPLKFSHLTVNEGLSSNTVTCLLQDSQGFMWIGTRDGLSRYDGYGFEVYRRETKNDYSLPANSINDLFEDSQQTLWVATQQGICKYDRQLNRFVRIEEIVSHELTDDVASAFLEDKENKLWATSEKTLYYLDRESNQFIACPPFAKANISSCLPLDKDKFLFTTLGAGLYIYDAKSGETQQYLHQDNNENSLCSNDAWSAYKDIDGYIWIGTEHGLDRFNLQKQTFEHFKLDKDASKSLLVASIRQIIGRKNEIWFATENGGLSMLDLKNMNFTHHLPQADNPKSINDISIWAMYWDNQNRLWVGTFSGGVNIADPHGEKFSSPSIILKNKIVNAMLQDSKNRLWVGTERGLAVKEDKKTTYYIHDPKQPNSLPNNPVLAILEDHRQRIWISTWGGGLSLFDEKIKKFTNFPANPKNPTKLTNADIYGLAQSSQTQEMLATSWGGGLHILQDETQQNFLNFTKQPDNKQSISDNMCKRVYEDSKKNIWVGSNNGLNRFDIRTKKFTRYFHSKNDSNSISNDYINCIWEDSKGILWIGTSDGLNRMVDDKTFVSYTTADGFPNNTINGILDDNSGNLWVSTNRGLSRFNPETKEIRNYDESDGLQSRQFKNGSYFKAKDGQLFFGGVHGFNAFYPDSIQDNPYIPLAIISNLKIFNQPVKIGEFDSILRQDISQTKEITLSYQYSVFTLEFVGLNLTHPEKNQYAYELEGFEKGWNYVGNQRSTTYTNLDAGTYIFKVKASNNDGIWNEKETKLIIHILPPWWKTWWFRLFVILIFLVGGPVFYIFRMNTIKRQNQKLEQLVSMRTQELSDANQTLQAYAEELLQNQEEIATLNNHLEVLVEERTRKLIKSNQKLNEYAFFNAHKLRSPIATILGLYEVLKLDISSVEREIVFEKIREVIVHLDEIVRRSQSLLDELDE